MTNTLEQLNEAKVSGEAPEWLTEEAYHTLKSGYLHKDETPRGMYRRVAKAAAVALDRLDLEEKFYQYIDKNWICLSTPVAANLSVDKGDKNKNSLPISCYSVHLNDTTYDIFETYKEQAILSKFGGGCGAYWSDVRGRGAPIGDGSSVSEGIIPWLKVQESTIQAISQAGVRRGSSACYLDVTHADIDAFIDIRRPTGDQSQRCLSSSFHHAVVIPDVWMQSMIDGDVAKRKLWNKILTTRIETGEPFIMFSDNANKNLPESYGLHDLKVSTSNLCTEIFLPTDKNHSFVCCLSSLNVARVDEWADDLVETAVYFLDAVLTVFIDRASKIPGFEKTVRFAKKSRALGLGVLGWHSLLQKNSYPYDSFDSFRLNAEIFSRIKREATAASKKLAKEYGEVEWTKGSGMRNLTLIAVAPTVSNAIISGNLSNGIEALSANYYAQKTAKGTFIRKNPVLQKLLQDKGMDKFEVWQRINEDVGSVKNVDCLSAHEKEVFLTAREINQFAVIKQCAQRQAKWIDQGQSINLFFAAPKNMQDEQMKKDLGKYIHLVHLNAWKEGIKSLYYLRMESMLKGESALKTFDENVCVACDG